MLKGMVVKIEVMRTIIRTANGVPIAIPNTHTHWCMGEQNVLLPHRQLTADTEQLCLYLGSTQGPRRLIWAYISLQKHCPEFAGKGGLQLLN